MTTWSSHCICHLVIRNICEKKLDRQDEWRDASSINHNQCQNIRKPRHCLKIKYRQDSRTHFTIIVNFLVSLFHEQTRLIVFLEQTSSRNSSWSSNQTDTFSSEIELWNVDIRINVFGAQSEKVFSVCEIERNSKKSLCSESRRPFNVSLYGIELKEIFFLTFKFIFSH